MQFHFENKFSLTLLSLTFYIIRKVLFRNMILRTFASENLLLITERTRSFLTAADEGLVMFLHSLLTAPSYYRFFPSYEIVSKY